MSHLSKENIEDILQGRMPEPDHVRECHDCRASLEEARALAARLHSAFGSLHAGSGLLAGIRAATIEKPSVKPIRIHTYRRWWSSVAAAAVILLCMVPIGLFMKTSSQVRASQGALSGIHHQGLEHPDRFFHAGDPNHMADHLEKLTGQRPVMVCTAKGLVVVGCCTCTFMGREVATYMVTAKAGPISIVVLPESPADVGLEHDETLGMWTATSRCCRLAAIQLGDCTYCAVGDVPHAALAEVLAQLAR